MIAPVAGASRIDAPAPPVAGNTDSGIVSPEFGAVLTRAAAGSVPIVPAAPAPAPADAPAPSAAQTPPAPAHDGTDPGADSALPDAPPAGAPPAILEQILPATEPERPRAPSGSGEAAAPTPRDPNARTRADAAPPAAPERAGAGPLDDGDAPASRTPALKHEAGAGLGRAPSPDATEGPETSQPDTRRDARAPGAPERTGPERRDGNERGDDANASTRADLPDPRRLTFQTAGVDLAREAQPPQRDSALNRSIEPAPGPAEQPTDPRSGAGEGRTDDDGPPQREAPARAERPSQAPADPIPERAPFALERTPDAGVAPRAGIGQSAAQPAPVAVAPPRSAPVPQRAPDADPNASMIARGLTAAVQQRGGSVTIRLAPESLGLVRVHLTVSHETVSARLEASTPQAQRLLTEHLPMLKGSLESRGLKVERLAVQHAPAPVSAPVLPASPGSVAPTALQTGADTGHDAAGGQSRGRGESEHRHHAEPQARAGHAEEADPLTDPASWRFDRRFRLRLETVA